MRWAGLTALLAVMVFAAVPARGQDGGTVIPMDPTRWEAAPADGVALTLAGGEGPDTADALRLEYDFQGRGGWAAARHGVTLALPESYEIRFLLRGEADGSPPNHLEIKLVDSSGENVWWHVERDLPWPEEWTPVRIRSRRLEFAWGPLGGGPPRDLAAIELTVTAGGGGAGWIEVAGLEIVPTEPLRPPEGPPVVTSTGSLPRRPPVAALDGDPVTAWEPADVPAELSIDLRGRIELGGLSFLWAPGLEPERFRVEVFEGSEDGDATIVREVESRGAPESHLRLPDTVAAGLRIAFGAGDCPRGCGLSEITIRPLDFGASMNGFLTALAAEAPRGAWPRGFSGEAVYWTVVGVPGAGEEALLSEDGAVEVGEKGFTVEPFVRLAVEGGSRLFTWNDVEAERSLAEGDLPIPTVAWRLEEAGARLEVTALADGPAEASTLRLRYRLENRGTEVLDGTLYLAVRPFQVNPPVQFLNVAGGHAPVSRIECRPRGVEVTGAVSPEGRTVTAAPAPDACGAQPFARGRLVDPLVAGEVPPESAASDPDGLASGALAWDVDLAPGETMEVVVAVPLAPRGETGAPAIPGDFDAAEAAARQAWRRALGPLALELPPEAAPLVLTLRSSLAWILIHQDGPAIQPGSRAYARSWIRDGALTGTALLRLGHSEAAKAFAEWFARYQYPDGKVPCCVDRRGADPVDEHDSHGELIHLVREVYRYTGDRAFAERMLPHVKAAADHLEALRQSRRTPEYESGGKRAFYGLLPESISHEGYSAKPVHSYWDDAFGYRGLADAAALAEELGPDLVGDDLAAEWAARRDGFRDDFLASIEAVRERDGLAYLPASADLGDFDPTSTTILLDPGGLLPWLEDLPGDPLHATFGRYRRGIRERWPTGPESHESTTGWDAYTPYEIRHVGAFVRLGWKSEAHELLAHFLADRRPLDWNAWPEVVTRDPRTRQFLGDLPHGWVASDFVRSVLDLFAYEEREAERLVLGAGVPAEWLMEEDGGIAVRRLGTPWGELSYDLEGLEEGGVRYRIEELTGPAAGAPPTGGLALEYPLPAPDGPPATATVDGRPAEVGDDGRVVVRRLPAIVEWPAQSGNRVDIVIRTEDGSEVRE